MESPESKPEDPITDDTSEATGAPPQSHDPGEEQTVAPESQPEERVTQSNDGEPVDSVEAEPATETEPISETDAESAVGAFEAAQELPQTGGVEPITEVEPIAGTEPIVEAELVPITEPEPVATPVSDAETTAQPTVATTTVAPAPLPEVNSNSQLLIDQRGIQVIGVSRSFGRVKALTSVTFTAQPGKITALIGPNGSGKTTLLLILATLLAPNTGSIKISGLDPATQSAEVRKKIGWMPDSIGTWPTLTVYQTLKTVGKMYKLSGKNAKTRATELIGLVGLQELADRPTRVLSRGQKQKLSLARALVNDPDVLLLDEPASGLDPQARIDLRNILRGLADKGKTILVSSHVLSELDEIAHDAVFIADGSTVTEDEVRQASAESIRSWRITSLDLIALEQALSSLNLQYELDSQTRTALVDLYNEESAAALLADLISRDVPVSAYQPAVGRLEQTFIDLNRGV